MARPASPLIDVSASQRNLADHLAPIYLALPEDRQGTFWAGQRGLPAHLADRWGIAATLGHPHSAGGVTLVANHHDITQAHPSRPIVLLEHGAGQTYQDFVWHPAYSGGRDGYRDRVALFLTVNDVTAARERSTYPDACVEVVGSPRLDVLSAIRHDLCHVASRGMGTVGLCWHWRCNLVPESRTCWPEYRAHLGALDGLHLLGHGHPRIYAELAPQYAQRGIDPTPDFETLVAHADVIVFDNTSAGYEAAALDVPVLAVNGAEWRRDVHHGLRFWDQVPGPQIDSGRDLHAGVVAAQDPAWRTVRREISARVYPERTRGRAAQLAVDAILSVFPV